jgi:alanine transaminase
MNGLRTHYLDKFLPPKKEKKNASPSRRIIELEFLHYPITDLSIPTMSQLDGLVETIIERAKDQDVMYLHCWGGRGRAGTVGACVLGKMYGLSGEEALTRVQRAFDTRNDGGRKSPETPEQQNLVKAYLA